MQAEKTATPREKALRGRRPRSATPGREALLRAALAHFARHGYEATSLRSLALEAEVDVALVARLFGSKAELWVAVVDQLVTLQTMHLERLGQLTHLCQQQPREALQGLIQLFADLSYEIPAFAAFLMHEMSNPGERVKMLIKRLVTPFRSACTPVLQAAIKSGHLRATDPDMVFGMLISAIAVPMGGPGIVGKGPRLTAKLRDEIAREAIRMLGVAT